MKELDQISGEIVESFVVNYAKLEPETSFTNASKIRYPATLFHCGKVFRPVENSMGKIKVRLGATSIFSIALRSGAEWVRGTQAGAGTGSKKWSC